MTVSKIVLFIVIALLTGIFWGMSCPLRLPVWTVYGSWIWTIPYALFLGRSCADLSIQNLKNSYRR